MNAAARVPDGRHMIDIDPEPQGADRFSLRFRGHETRLPSRITPETLLYPPFGAGLWGCEGRDGKTETEMELWGEDGGGWEMELWRR